MRYCETPSGTQTIILHTTIVYALLSDGISVLVLAVDKITININIAIITIALLALRIRTNNSQDLIECLTFIEQSGSLLLLIYLPFSEYYLADCLMG